MSHEFIGLLGLAIALLGTVIVSTWRFSALASKLLSAVEQQKADSADVKTKLGSLDKIPQIEIRLGQLEKNHSMIPKLSERITVVEQAAKFSKEMRAVRFGSRPDTDEE